MSTLKKRQDLEDVLNEYMASEQIPTHEGLKRWISLYPEYETELTKFTVNWGLMEYSTSGLIGEISEETLVLRAMSIVEDCLYSSKEKEKLIETVISNLFDEAQNSGLGIQELAVKCKVSIPIITKLARRFIDYDTIPRQLIDSLATALGRTFLSVADYLRLPVLAEGMHFSAKNTPILLKQEDFFHAVRNDRNLGPDLRQYWLSLEDLANNS